MELKQFEDAKEIQDRIEKLEEWTHAIQDCNCVLFKGNYSLELRWSGGFKEKLMLAAQEAAINEINIEREKLEKQFKAI